MPYIGSIFVPPKPAAPGPRGLQIVRNEISNGVLRTGQQAANTRALIGRIDNAQGPIYNNTPDPPPPEPSRTALTYDAKELIYNIGCVKDAYFRDHRGFFKEMSTTAEGKVTDRVTTVTNPNQLWQNAGKNKGMITLFVPAGSDPGQDGAVVPAADSKLQPAEHHRYGFQFHYNPTEITMNFAGAPNTDAGMEISGQEKFNLVGSQVTQSTISFDMVFNRVFDMNYYKEDGTIKPDFKKAGGTDLYSPRMPKNTTEEKEIFNKGTMYDVEYLLSTVLGFKLNTKLRGVTADVGWLSGRPVELYLGRSLKYVGFINNFSLTHKMFNERMTPIFSIASLSFNRIPDYNGM